MLNGGFDRYKVHVRPGRRFTNGSRIIGVILATFALQPIGCHQVCRDDLCIQPQRNEFAGPMVGATATLHSHHAAYWQLRTPCQELVSAQLPVSEQFACSIYSVNLDHRLCPIDANSCNLTHGTSPLKGFRLTFANQSWHLMPLLESEESLRICCMLDGTNKNDGFWVRARRKPQRYQGVSRGFATQPWRKRRAFMFQIACNTAPGAHCD